MAESRIAPRLAQAIREHREELVHAWSCEIARIAKRVPSGTGEIACHVDRYLQEVASRLEDGDQRDSAVMDPLTPFERIHLLLTGEEVIAERLTSIVEGPSPKELLVLRRELNRVFTELIRLH